MDQEAVEDRAEALAEAAVHAEDQEVDLAEATEAATIIALITEDITAGADTTEVADALAVCSHYA